MEIDEIGEACGLAGAMEFKSPNGPFGEDPRDLRTLPAVPTTTSTYNYGISIHLPARVGDMIQNIHLYHFVFVRGTVRRK